MPGVRGAGVSKQLHELLVPLRWANQCDTRGQAFLLLFTQKGSITSIFTNEDTEMHTYELILLSQTC